MTWLAPELEILDWAAAGHPLPGQSVSGDAHVVAPFSGGALVAVIDGLGHGPEANKAANAAVEVLRRDPGCALEALVAHCHQALARLRGAVMTLASFDARQSTMTWLGIGNVESALLRRSPAPGQPMRERLLLRGGIVGQMLPRLQPATLVLATGDTLVLATDGLDTGSIGQTRNDDSVQSMADRLLGEHARGTDDALVVVARYRSSMP